MKVFWGVVMLMISLTVTGVNPNKVQQKTNSLQINNVLTFMVGNKSAYYIIGDKIAESSLQVNDISTGRAIVENIPLSKELTDFTTHNK